MSRTIEEIIEYVQNNYDPNDLVEIFELSTEEILDRFEDKVLYYQYKFEEEIEEEADELGYDYS